MSGAAESRTLLVLRHAKSSWADAELDDHERPLNKRGRRAAPLMARLLAERGPLPERILSSSAVRALATARAVAEHCAFGDRIEVVDELYLATTSEILAVLRRVPADVRRVMIVGHNPGLEDLVAELTGCEERFPTAALAHVELPIADWRALASGIRGHLVGLWRPRDLED